MNDPDLDIALDGLDRATRAAFTAAHAEAAMLLAERGDPLADVMAALARAGAAAGDRAKAYAASIDAAMAEAAGVVIIATEGPVPDGPPDAP